MTDKRQRSAGDLLARLRSSAEEHPPFVEGLALGALVGAAIAGSTLWARIREARRERDASRAAGSADSRADPH